MVEYCLQIYEAMDHVACITLALIRVTTYMNYLQLNDTYF